MTIANRLQALAKYRITGWHYSIGTIPHFLAQNRRPRTTLAGAFVLLVGLVSAAGTQAIHAITGGGSDSAVQPAAATSVSAAEVTTGNTPSPAADAGPGAAQSTSSVQVSTTTDSTPSDSAPSTQVTVNGKPVPVPANGSAQQTINSGNQQTNISVSQTTTGQNHTNNQVHVFSQSTSDTSEENSVSSD